MEIFLVYCRKSNGLADGVAYNSRDAALLSMGRHGMSEDDYKLASFNLASLTMVQRWIESDEV